MLGVAALAWAAPWLTIESGPSGPTRDATPTFEFAADPGATVECSIDDGEPAWGPCSDVASHTPASELPDGDHVFHVRAVDGDGETVASRTFSVDTAPPSVSIVSGPVGLTNDSTPSFGFGGEEGASFECSVDQGVADWRACSSPFTTAVLADGAYTFHVRATDAAGNQASATRSFSVDTVAPSVSIDSGPAGLTNDSTPSFAFGAEAGASFECSVDQGVADWRGCSSPFTSAALVDGAYTFRVRATDSAGNRASATRSFSVDTVAPSVSIDSGPAGLTNDSTPSFGFSAPGASFECSVDQGVADWRACSSPFTTAVLADGAYTFRVRATDAAGNQASATRSFSVDTVAPSVSIDSGPAGPTNDKTPSFAFGAEAGATVECSVDQGVADWRGCSSPFTTAVLADGAYTFRVRATDSAGNRATAEQAFSVDSAAPLLSIDSGPAGPTNAAAPSFGFTAGADTRLECSVDQGTAVWRACSSPFTTAVLADGSYTFRVRATKLVVGNQAVETRRFTVDTVPPALAIGFGPSGVTNDNTPLFGFTAEGGAAVECSIDQGAAAYGPCASGTTHAAASPLADGAYVFRVRATDGVGNAAILTQAFTVDTAPPVPDPQPPTPDHVPRADAAPPSTPRVTPTPAPRMLSPFPLVRISGTLTRHGARVRLLTVRAPQGALVRVTVDPGCRTRRRSRRCRVLKAAATVGRAAVGFRSVERTYRSGTVIEVRVWRADQIGKYTRFTIVRGKAPRRVDQCLLPGATRGIRCPSA